jgi:hypothetical protein
VCWGWLNLSKGTCGGFLKQLVFFILNKSKLSAKKGLLGAFRTGVLSLFLKK